MYNQEDLNPVLAHDLKDETLMKLVTVSGEGAKISVTLIVEGLVVYGDIISGGVYCDEMLKKLNQDAGDPKPIGALREYFQSLKDSFYSESDGSRIKPFYLHLENYSFLTGNGNRLISENDILRVSIQKVSAFSLGRPA
ncbi:hypothetical protein [Pantoea dispersa]|uniref:hypothetical protein n=1 Tax=Pantoea dispersa TaxID=59814 RepID=UPI0021C5B54E|nr:hypothetical protein [Pantoea dispersa]UXO69973.1 hypothetical protein N7977_08225 [Pantoea dispersa]